MGTRDFMSLAIADVRLNVYMDRSVLSLKSTEKSHNANLKTCLVDMNVKQ